MKRVFTAIFCLACIVGTAQKQTFQGEVIDAKSSESIAFAAIQIKGTLSGTTSNEKGFFSITIGPSDTLEISSLGYANKLIWGQDCPIDPCEIALRPWNFELEEVTVRPKSPEDYIRAAIEEYPGNVFSDPFNTLSYFEESIHKQNDQGQEIRSNRAIFYSFYPNFIDTSEDVQHRLDLFEERVSGEFRSILLDNRKYNKRIDSLDGIELPFGEGPDMSLYFFRNILELDFLQPSKFKKIHYTFGPPAYYQDEELIAIRFESKRRIDYSRFSGTIYLGVSDLAIVALDYHTDFRLPFYINPLLRAALGIRVKGIGMSFQLHQQPHEGKWYPKNFIGQIKFNIKQKSEVETILVKQLLNVAHIETNEVRSIELDKRLTKEKDLKDQVYRESGRKWSDVYKEGE